MQKTVAAALFALAVLLCAPFQVDACKSCENPEFWNPDCNVAGCNYCVACEVCCPGGTYCDVYCGGGNSALSASTRLAPARPLSELFSVASPTQEAPVLPFLASCGSSARAAGTSSGR